MTNSETVNWPDNLIKELAGEGARWIPVEARLPENMQECLLTIFLGGVKYVAVGTYSTDLYSVHKYDFEDRKGKAGWYYRDSEYGFCEHYGVTAWMPLPKPHEGDTE